MSQVERGRDVMLLMQQRGEQGMKEAIIKIAEDNTMMHAELKELRLVVKNVIEQLAMQMGVMKEHAGIVEKIERKYNPNNEANPDQKWST